MNNTNLVSPPKLGYQSASEPLLVSVARPPPLYPPIMKIASRGNQRRKFFRHLHEKKKICAKENPEPNEPSTARGRERRLKARSLARFIIARFERKNGASAPS